MIAIPPAALPIDPLLPEIREHFREHACLVLQASPGSGKTTRVPAALLESPELRGQEIWVLEPRRLAAKWAARRVAQELGEEVGASVGYQFRFETVGGPRTRLRFFTEGTLARKLLSAPDLKGVGVVVLDEFHERHLAGDVVLGHLKRLQAAGSRIRILVMSATLDGERLSAHLGGCRVMNLHAHAHPVELTYADKAPDLIREPRELAPCVRQGVRRVWEGMTEGSRGDILVFLPGLGEIRRAEEAVAGLELPADILTLHGEMERDAQDRVMSRAPAGSRGARPRIVLSTNVAESSLTIDGVRAVVDSGLHKQAMRSEWTGIPALRLRPISRASAAQRAGRAGRQGPGRCHRLYTRHDHDTRPPFDPPELARVDLAQVVLELSALGVPDPLAFPWLDAPSATSVRESQDLLERLGAVEPGSGNLTETGRALSRFSAHPRLSRLILEGARLGVADQAILLAALLSEQALEQVEAEEGFARAWRSARSGPLAKLESQLRSQLPGGPPPRARAEWDDVSARVALAGFPDRVARPAGGQWLLATGGSVDGPAASLTPASELAVVLSARETRGRTRIEALWPAREDDLLSVEPSPLAERVEWAWDKARGRIQKHTSLRYFELALSEETLEHFTSEDDRRASAEAFLRLALKLPQPTWESLGQALRTSIPGGQEIDERVSRIFRRAKLLAENGGPAPPLPEPIICLAGATRLAHLTDLDWEEALLRDWSYDDRARLDKLCPTAIALKNGRRCTVNYEQDRTPWIESRLQDFFGERTTPTILGGKLPLLVHLLAPNHRPIQITQDLEGFWARVYPEVRRELSRNYPRHPWPEDPLKAEPPPLKKPRG